MLRLYSQLRLCGKSNQSIKDILRFTYWSEANMDCPKVTEPSKRKLGNERNSKQKKRKVGDVRRIDGSHEQILQKDIASLMQKLSLSNSSGMKVASATANLPEPFSTIELKIELLSSTGDGLGFKADSAQIYVVPFSVPGDIILAKVIRHVPHENHSIADFIKVIKPSKIRDDALIKCKYFANCSGCQFQMLPYGEQLEHKRGVVEKAYQNFSGLPSQLVPVVENTIGSPLQYAYRTKLTPHFDGPPGGRRAARKGEVAQFEEVPPIGFMKKGQRKTLDIEECPIGTEAVEIGLRRERKRVAAELKKYRKGATILLRENTERQSKTNGETTQATDSESQTVFEDRGPYSHVKSCITDNKAITTEYVEDYIFQNPANAFFQNNNSILPVFTSYIRDHILPTNPSRASLKINNLIDAYSGSGLFTITLSELFRRSIGIDISGESIDFARKNAKLNKLDQRDGSSVEFIAADAVALFDSVSSFNPDETVVVIDPPRKGCDINFLKQLLAFAPARIVYVSCNVHTQARDVGWILRSGHDEVADAAEPQKRPPYLIENVRGFDFFPQTSHVESVVILQKDIMMKALPLQDAITV